MKNSQNYLTTYQPPKTIQEVTFRTVIEKPHPVMKKFALLRGAFEVQALICDAIIKTQLQINCSKGLIIDNERNINQPAACAALIYSEYGNRMSIDDFYLCLKNGLMNRYKPIFDSFDITIISAWCNSYMEDKANQFQRIESTIVKEQEKLPEAPLTEEAKERIAKMKAEILTNLQKIGKESNLPKKETQRELSESEKYYISVMQKFDLLWKEQKYPTNAVKQRIVVIDDKEFTQEEYLKYKELNL